MTDSERAVLAIRIGAACLIAGAMVRMIGGEQFDGPFHYGAVIFGVMVLLNVGRIRPN